MCLPFLLGLIFLISTWRILLHTGFDETTEAAHRVLDYTFTNLASVPINAVSEAATAAACPVGQAAINVGSWTGVQSGN